MKSIEANDLSRYFNGFCAVDSLTFSVDEGEIFGFLGPNGAGKTTTIRMLSGQLDPTSGNARIVGWDVKTETQRLKPLIGVVSDYQNLFERMTARENLIFAAKLYGVDYSRVETLLQKIHLEDRTKEPIKKFSNGMKQRLLIARAMLHNPKVLFLDEPTRGLDPISAQEIRKIITDLSTEGTTIFLTTHYMEEADHLCSRVAFLNQGKIVALDAPENLKISHGQPYLQAKLKDGTLMKFEFGLTDTGQKVAELIDSGRLLTLHSAEATLEEVFLKLTGRTIDA